MNNGVLPRAIMLVPALVLVLPAAACVSEASQPTSITTAAGSTTSISASTTTRSAVPPDPPTTRGPAVASSDGSLVSILLVGDVMLGRGVAPYVRRDPTGLFEDVRHVVTSADFAAANLESPLTRRQHIASNPYALEADPQFAGALATAGFDLVGIANNHSGDAGRLSILDTIEAVEGAGLLAVGGGSHVAEAEQVRVLEQAGVRVGFLAFDATRAGTAATSTDPGIATWEEESVRGAVAAARPEVDVLVVGLHGGVEYYTNTDPAMAALAAKLVGWGADVVWGHGPHVVQPISVTHGERPAVVATSLGNFLFDQFAAGTREGAVLEVLAGRQGIVAYRTGTADHHDGLVHFNGWELPTGGAVLLGLEWWNLIRDTRADPRQTAAAPSIDFPGGEVVAAGRGDVTEDGAEDLVVSYRRPFEENDITRRYPDRQWADEAEKSAHLGVYRPADLRQIWVAGTLFRPVADFAVCDGALALAFDSLDVPEIVATGGWVWEGFGFTTVAELPGPGTPGCLDVDGDGLAEPVIIDRSGGPPE